MIQVKYRDGVVDMVQAYMLQYLLAANRVLQFKRSDGWVTVGVDPLRGPGPGNYTGPERRRFSLSS